MSRDLPDSHPSKWRLTEHSRVKHEIQRRYLDAWFRILGSKFPLVCIFEGFAGRGRYTGGEDGSPILIYKQAQRVLDEGRVKEVRMRCVELDKQNFESLEFELDALDDPRIKLRRENKPFATAASEAADRLAAVKLPPPVFWTVDPFGFTGVPFDVIESIMSLERSEVLLTFMVGSMHRFFEHDNTEQPMSDFFGGDAWRACTSGTATEDREHELMLTYCDEVRRRGVAEFATPFRVFGDNRLQTIYYLIHLSNHRLGGRRMREAMLAASPDMTFWPVTRRPPDQLALDVGEQPPYPRLQSHLLEKYVSETVAYADIVDFDGPEGLWMPKAYRAAIRDLEDSSRVEVIRRNPTTPTGLPTKKIEDLDRITFL